MNRDESKNQFDWTPVQRESILVETQCILSHPALRNSKRCVALFRHLVDQALSGNIDSVKERTLGIEVFDREPDYDTNADPIVRMTANEIRKRLAQYYEEPTLRPVKIRIVSGTYLPQFLFETAQSPASATSPAEAPQLASAMGDASKPAAPEISRDVVKSRAWWAWISLPMLALLLLGFLSKYRSAGHSEQSVWSPLLNSKDPVTVCVGEINARRPSLETDWAVIAARTIASRTFEPANPGESQLPSVPIVDVMVAGRITSWLTAHHRDSKIRGGKGLTLSDLRHGPVVLIGIFDNPWSLILLSPLRFHMRVDPVTQDEWVEDAENPSNRDWRGSGTLSYTGSSEDYALVTRVLDGDTGQWVIAAGGLGMHGTEAAGELLLDPAYADLLAGLKLPPQKNFQILLKTSVIAGNTGPPIIVAVHSW